MEKTSDTSIELARWFDNEGKKHTITIQQYREFVERQDKVAIANFVYQRLHSRYLKPFLFGDVDFVNTYKNGFSIMANCCLLIETLQSFKNGWGDSDRKSELAFKQFLETESEFSGFKEGVNLYKNIRCGILHQGETTGGWKINRNGLTNLVNKVTKEIDSVAFATELEKSLKKYSESLKVAAWDSELWDNFRTKMRKIIINCES